MPTKITHIPLNEGDTFIILSTDTSVDILVTEASKEVPEDKGCSAMTAEGVYQLFKACAHSDELWVRHRDKDYLTELAYLPDLEVQYWSSGIQHRTTTLGKLAEVSEDVYNQLRLVLKTNESDDVCYVGFKRLASPQGTSWVMSRPYNTQSVAEALSCAKLTINAQVAVLDNIQHAHRYDVVKELHETSAQGELARTHYSAESLISTLDGTPGFDVHYLPGIPVGRWCNSGWQLISTDVIARLVEGDKVRITVRSNVHPEVYSVTWQLQDKGWLTVDPVAHKVAGQDHDKGDVEKMSELLTDDQDIDFCDRVKEQWVPMEDVHESLYTAVKSLVEQGSPVDSVRSTSGLVSLLRLMPDFAVEHMDFKAGQWVWLDINQIERLDLGAQVRLTVTSMKSPQVYSVIWELQDKGWKTHALRLQTHYGIYPRDSFLPWVSSVCNDVKQVESSKVYNPLIKTKPPVSTGKLINHLNEAYSLNPIRVDGKDIGSEVSEYVRNAPIGKTMVVERLNNDVGPPYWVCFKRCEFGWWVYTPVIKAERVKEENLTVGYDYDDAHKRVYKHVKKLAKTPLGGEVVLVENLHALLKEAPMFKARYCIKCLSVGGVCRWNLLTSEALGTPDALESLAVGDQVMLTACNKSGSKFYQTKWTRTQTGFTLGSVQMIDTNTV